MFQSSHHSSPQLDQTQWVGPGPLSLVKPTKFFWARLLYTIVSGPDGQPVEFDGKRLRKTMMRKTVDYNSSFINMLHNRVNQYSIAYGLSRAEGIEIPAQDLSICTTKMSIEAEDLPGELSFAQVWARDYRDRRAIQPDICFYPDIVPPQVH